MSSAWRERKTEWGLHCCFHLLDMGSLRKWRHNIFLGSIRKKKINWFRYKGKKKIPVRGKQPGTEAQGSCATSVHADIQNLIRWRPRQPYLSWMLEANPALSRVLDLQGCLPSQIILQLFSRLLKLTLQSMDFNLRAPGNLSDAFSPCF